MKAEANRISKRQWIITVIVLIVLACLQYFIRLDYDTSFVNDEFQSVSVAQNVNAGLGLVRSDKISYVAKYTRGWPSTYLLAGWMKLFGVSEISCRALSALIGVFFIGSAIYVSYKLFQNYYFTILSCLTLIAEPNLTKNFRIVRMYPLEMLLSLWMIYLFFLGITERNPFWKNRENSTGLKGKLCRWLDFQWIYLLLAFVLVYLNYVNLVTCLISLGGVAIFVVFKALTEKEPKYRFCLTLALFLLLGCGVNFVVWGITGEFALAKSVFSKFVYYAGFKGIQYKYLGYAFQSLGVLGTPLTIILFVMCVAKKKLNDTMWYLVCIDVFSMVFLVFFSAKKYDANARYLISVIPWIVFLLCYTVMYITEKPQVWKILYGILIIWPVILLGRHLVVYGFMENKNDTDFLTAYSTITEYYDVEKEPVPIYEFFLRKYYYAKVIPREDEYVYKGMTRSTTFKRFYGFIQNEPEGIISVEGIKVEALKQSFPEFISEWTDRLSGPGLDKTGVYVSHYNYLLPTDDCEGMQVNLDRKDIEEIYKEYPNAKLLLISVDFVIDSETVTRYFQLQLPDENEEAHYSFTPDRLRNMDVNSIKSYSVNEKMALYCDREIIDWKMK